MGLQAAWSPGEGAPSLPSLAVPLHQCAPRHCAGHPAVTWTDTVLCPYGADGPVREQVIHRSKIISKRGHAVKGLHGDERATGKPLRWGVRLGPSVKATSELQQEGGASRGGGPGGGAAGTRGSCGSEPAGGGWASGGRVWRPRGVLPVTAATLCSGACLLLLGPTRPLPGRRGAAACPPRSRARGWGARRSRRSQPPSWVAGLDFPRLVSGAGPKHQHHREQVSLASGGAEEGRDSRLREGVGPGQLLTPHAGQTRE